MGLLSPLRSRNCKVIIFPLLRAKSQCLHFVLGGLTWQDINLLSTASEHTAFALTPFLTAFLNQLTLASRINASFYFFSSEIHCPKSLFLVLFMFIFISAGLFKRKTATLYFYNSYTRHIILSLQSLFLLVIECRLKYFYFLNKLCHYTSFLLVFLQLFWIYIYIYFHCIELKTKPVKMAISWGWVGENVLKKK